MALHTRAYPQDPEAGPTDKRASAIGLYLCRQICSTLGHGLSASSEVGKGTVIRIGLSRQSITME